MIFGIGFKQFVVTENSSDKKKIKSQSQFNTCYRKQDRLDNKNILLLLNWMWNCKKLICSFDNIAKKRTVQVMKIINKIPFIFGKRSFLLIIKAQRFETNFGAISVASSFDGQLHVAHCCRKDIEITITIWRQLGMRAIFIILQFV